MGRKELIVPCIVIFICSGSTTFDELKNRVFEPASSLYYNQVQHPVDSLVDEHFTKIKVRDCHFICLL